MFDALQRYIPFDSEGTNTAIILVTALGLFLSVAVLVLNARKNHLAKISSDEKNMAIASAQEIAAQALKDAADANERAARANERAAEANEQAGKANQRATENETASLKLRVDLETESATSRTRQTELALQQQKTADAQRSAAQAQLALQKYVSAIANGTGRRGINDQLFLSHLRNTPPGRVQVYYIEGSPETYLFAGSIQSMFRSARWTVESPDPLPINTLVGLGGGTSLNEIIVAMGHTELSVKKDAREAAVWNAILSLKRNCGQWKDETAPEDLFRIYVGPAIGPLLAPLN